MSKVRGRVSPIKGYIFSAPLLERSSIHRFRPPQEIRSIYHNSLHKEGVSYVVLDHSPIERNRRPREHCECQPVFRDVLEEGTLEQRKEFLRGFVHEISIDPDTAR